MKNICDSRSLYDHGISTSFPFSWKLTLRQDEELEPKFPSEIVEISHFRWKSNIGGKQRRGSLGNKIKFKLLQQACIFSDVRLLVIFFWVYYESPKFRQKKWKAHSPFQSEFSYACVRSKNIPLNHEVFSNNHLFISQFPWLRFDFNSRVYCHYNNYNYPVGPSYCCLSLKNCLCCFYDSSTSLVTKTVCQAIYPLIYCCETAASKITKWDHLCASSRIPRFWSTLGICLHSSTRVVNGTWVHYFLFSWLGILVMPFVHRYLGN